MFWRRPNPEERITDGAELLNYLDGIEKAIAYIEANLQSELSPETVAGEIGFSVYHFHRIFKAMTGETIAEHIRKRRLSNSARHLISSERPIMEIALESGFETQESFTRAFKKMFGTTPHSYRKSGRISPIVGNETFEPEVILHLRSGVTMEPYMVHREAETVVGMGNSYREEAFSKISKLWEEFVPHMGAVKNVKVGYTLGVCLQSHPDINLKEGDTFVYMASVPVTRAEALPQGMVSYTIPASRYAVFTHKGPLANLPQTIRYIWGTWVPRNSELHKKNAPDLEVYDERFNPETLDGEFDIYVPVND